MAGQVPNGAVAIFCATPLNTPQRDTGMQSGSVGPKPDARGRDTCVNQRTRWEAGRVYRKRLPLGQATFNREPMPPGLR